MSTMVMLIGPTGCGKTTFRKEHLSWLPCVSPDDFIVGKWSPRKAAHAWQHARNMAIELLLERQSFVADAQFLDPLGRSEWTRLARGFGFEARAFMFDTSWKQIRKNQQARGARGLYGEIPLDVQRRSFQLMKEQLRGRDFESDQRAHLDVVKFGSKQNFNLENLK